ncbi:MAG: hypothetical protein KKB13_06350 [Chloroflexi bacterium]|nr:hypothetical protein [Chloroflexota bacterium]
MRWLDMTHEAPISWLLEPENPSVRYWTLVDLLDRSPDDPEAREARAAIATWPPVAELLAAQKPEGHWINRDYYLPKYNGTFWTLIVLGDLGLTAENEHIRRACEFLFTFQCEENGAFCRRRRVAGRGVTWAREPGPCTHARIVRFLIQLGYQNDPRTRAGIDWLLANQREDGMWHCRTDDRYNCLRATGDVLRFAALDPATAAHPAIARAADAVCDLLMRPSMGKYHVKNAWTTLEYPYFDYSLLSTLDALARLGYTVEHPRIAQAMEYLLSRQLPDGAWPLDQHPRPLPFDVGKPGRPNKWLTLDALRVIKLLT